MRKHIKTQKIYRISIVFCILFSFLFTNLTYIQTAKAVSVTPLIKDCKLSIKAGLDDSSRAGLANIKINFSSDSQTLTFSATEKINMIPFEHKFNLTQQFLDTGEVSSIMTPSKAQAASDSTYYLYTSVTQPTVSIRVHSEYPDIKKETLSIANLTILGTYTKDDSFGKMVNYINGFTTSYIETGSCTNKSFGNEIESIDNAKVFFTATTPYRFDFKDTGGKEAPTIVLASFPSGTPPRPEITFRFKYLISKGGTFTTEDNLFYFTVEKLLDKDGKTVVNKSLSKLAIVLKWNGEIESLAYITNITDYSASGKISILEGEDRIQITPKEKILSELINRVYNQKDATDATICSKVVGPKTGNPTSNWVSTDTIQAHCINLSGTNIDKNGTPPSIEKSSDAEKGYMALWSITGNEASSYSPNGDAYKKKECGSATGVSGAVQVGLCNMTVAIREWALSILCYAQGKLVEVLGISSGTSAVCSQSENKPDSTMNNIFK